MGIGISTFTEIVGAGPGKHFDILGIKMFDSAEIRIHPTGSGIVRTGTRHQGQGHETTWAQIVGEELGLDPQELLVEEGDTDTAPYGLGTYASRSTPGRRRRARAGGAANSREGEEDRGAPLEAAEDDVEWKDYKFSVKGVPGKSVTMKEVAFAAYTNPPPDTEPGLEATYYYDPPNLTFPYGTYIAVVDVDRETGAVKVRRFLAVDDCGIVINPMIVEGQIHGGLTEGFAIAFMQEIKYDEERQQPQYELHRIPRPDRARDAALGDRQDGHAEPAPPDRRQRRRRKPERRLAAGVRQRGDGRALTAG